MQKLLLVSAALILASLTLETGWLPTAESSPVPQTTPCKEPRTPKETALFGTIFSPGTVTIPELGLSATIVDDCFAFRHLKLPRSPMLISLIMDAGNLQPATWSNYIEFTDGAQPTFTPTLHVGVSQEHVDPCPSLLHEDLTQSAAEQEHADLCRVLVGAAADSAVPAAAPANPGVTLPNTGGGTHASSSSFIFIGTIALALAGVAAFHCNDVARRRRRRTLTERRGSVHGERWL